MNYGLLCLALVLAVPASAATLNRLPGPVPAEVLRVVDGDTIEVRAHIWLGHEVTTVVRLTGIDTPELRGKCPEERAAARRAKAHLEAAIGTGPVVLRDIAFGKYAGRVTSRVETQGGADASASLIAAGLARPYAGRKRAGWCS